MRTTLLPALAVVLSSCTPRPTPTCHLEQGVPARLLGIAPSVMLLDLELATLGHARVRTDGCQEALLYVRSGGARLSVDDESVLLGPGDAARVVARTRRAASLVAESDAAVLLAYVRGGDTPFDPSGSSHQADHPPGACPPASGRRVVVARAGESGPHAQGDGSLRVFVYLDGPHRGAAWASLGYLDADATVAVPPHDHPDSTEHLFFESVDGTMQLGDTAREVRPGDFVVVPRGMRHAFTPSGDAPLRAFQLYAPSGPEQRFLPGTR